jgi:hypothetical protein
MTFAKNMELSSLRYFNEIKYLKRHSFYFKEIKIEFLK